MCAMTAGPGNAAAVSSSVTVCELEFATHSVRPSGAIATPHGNTPTEISDPATGISDLRSIGVTVFDPALATNADLPSGAMTIASGSLPTETVATHACVARSIAVTQLPEA